MLLPSPVQPQQSAPANATAAYPNDSEGLRQLLNNTLVAAKKEDQSELLSMIRETEIPSLGAGSGTATDPLIFGSVVLLLTLVAAAAVSIPARRAASTDPIVALHNE